MYDHAHPASLGARDVIAAWLVCLAVAVAAFAYPGFVTDPARKVQSALGSAALAGSCTVRDSRIEEKRG